MRQTEELEKLLKSLENSFLSDRASVESGIQQIEMYCNQFLDCGNVHAQIGTLKSTMMQFDAPHNDVQAEMASLLRAFAKHDENNQLWVGASE